MGLQIIVEIDVADHLPIDKSITLDVEEFMQRPDAEKIMDAVAKAVVESPVYADVCETLSLAVGYHRRNHPGAQAQWFPAPWTEGIDL